MSDAYHRSFQPAYHLPFNGYPYQSHSQYPPRYSQRSVQPLYPLKQPFPPHISHPPNFSAHPSSLRRRFSCHNSSRSQRPVSSLHNRATTLKKNRRSSNTQPSASRISEALSSIQLAKSRPHDWRSGYKPPSKSCFRRHFDRFTAPFTLTTTPRCILTPPVVLNFLLVATKADPPNVFYDLREPQINDAIFLPSLNRLPDIIDLCQLITSPPTHHMTLWHRKLPWKIKIEARQANGITIYDLFRQIHHQLHQPITKEDYYADELAPSDREILRRAFQVRCAMFPDKSRAGVQRIDFLGQEVCFIGLNRCRGGRWEFKTRLPPPKERMIID